GRSARSSGRNWNGRPGISKAVDASGVAGCSMGAAGGVTGAEISTEAVSAEARRSPRPVRLRNRRLSIPGLRGRLHTSVRLSLRLPACVLFVAVLQDRKSTRLNSSHVKISYAVFCLKKKNTTRDNRVWCDM